jgi:hypothetical protein
MACTAGCLSFQFSTCMKSKLKSNLKQYEEDLADERRFAQFKATVEAACGRKCIPSGPPDLPIREQRHRVAVSIAPQDSAMNAVDTSGFSRHMHLEAPREFTAGL